jgi:hypothetical protein
MDLKLVCMVMLSLVLASNCDLNTRGFGRPRTPSMPTIGSDAPQAEDKLFSYAPIDEATADIFVPRDHTPSPDEALENPTGPVLNVTSTDDDPPPDIGSTNTSVNPEQTSNPFLTEKTLKGE